jgi:hypothetical protein
MFHGWVGKVVIQLAKQLKFGSEHLGLSVSFRLLTPHTNNTSLLRSIFCVAALWNILLFFYIIIGNKVLSHCSIVEMMALHGMHKGPLSTTLVLPDR